MLKVELAKSIEARKLNQRTGRPVDTHWLTVPYGAILENPIEKGDLVEFSYLGELYHCKYPEIEDLLKSAKADRGSIAASPPANESARTVSPAAMLVWEKLAANYGQAQRAKVSGGWLVVVAGVGEGGGLTFYPDPMHSWDGSSA